MPPPRVLKPRDRCPCGSGRRYKNCCLRKAAEVPDPDPLGTLGFGRRAREPRRGWAAVGCGAAAVAVVALILYVMLHRYKLESPGRLVALGLGTAAYLFFGYTLHPKPELRNLGHGPIPVDRRFSGTDDLNRLLLVLMVALRPGRFAAEAIVDLVAVVRRRPPAVSPPATDREPPWQ